MKSVAKKSTQLIIRAGKNAAINSFQQMVLGNALYVNSIEQLIASFMLKNIIHASPKIIALVILVL